MCMCLAWGGLVGVDEWVRELGLGFNNPVGTGGMCDVCLCLGFGGVSDVEGGVGGCFARWLVHCLVGWVVLCLCVL